MKHPLNKWHWAGRELACFFLGHDWKYSKTVETQYYDMELEDVPYAYRKGAGYQNYMFESLAWWRQKCRRCRETHRDAQFNIGPWYKKWYYGIENAWGGMKTTVEIYVLDKYVRDTTVAWKRWLSVPVLIATWGFENFWVYFTDTLPSFPLSFASDIHSGLYDWMQKKSK